VSDRDGGLRRRASSQSQAKALRDLTEPLSAAKFLIERMSEPTPSEALKSRDPLGYEQLSRVPAFIFVRARKAE
jgi:hypothetical protein